MPLSRNDLGKLVSVYGPAPAFLQRAVILTVLSFLFFLGTMFVFYLRQGFVYFFLASFLVLYLISLVSVIGQRKNILTVYELGMELKDQRALWSEITSVDNDGQVRLENDKTIVIPKSLSDFTGAIRQIRSAILRS